MRARRLLLPLTLLLALPCAGSVALLALRDRPPDEAAPLCPDPTSAPGLVLEPPRVDLGRLEPGECRRVEISWRRIGPGPLRVLDHRAGCGCAVLGPMPPRLMAGDAGRLEVVVQGPERAGPLRVQVLVVTDARRRDPVHGKAITRIPIDGWVGRRLRAHPETLALGRRTLGARLERLIDVVAIPGLARDDVRATLHGLEGGVMLGTPMVRGRGGWTARVVVQVPSLAGPFAGRLRFEVAGDEPLAIPIEGEAVRLGAEPPRQGSSAGVPDRGRAPRAR